MAKLSDAQIAGLCQEVIDLKDHIVVLTDQIAMERAHREQAELRRDAVEADRDAQMVKVIEQTPYVECYRRLQTSVLGNPGLMDEWVRFCTVLKLADPDIHKFTTQD